MAASGCGVMNDIIEAMDVDGQLFVSAHNLPEFIERAMERGAEIERARVVAWCRFANIDWCRCDDAIERGEHLKEELK